MELRKHARFLYQPVLPIGKNRTLITGSKAHWDLACTVAAEGTVLLKNNGTLPLKLGTKVSLFGIGAGEFLFGGGGSGIVYTDRKISLADGLQAAHNAGKLNYFSETAEFYIDGIKKITDEAHKKYPILRDYTAWRRKTQMPLPVMPEELYQKAVAFGGTAIFCISRYTAEGDADGDREGGKGDFYLWDEEKELLDRLCADFEEVIVVLSTGGPVSTEEYKNNPKVGAVLYPLFGGGMAGKAIVQLLLGEKYPSGHLQHTIAYRLEDYPSTTGFHKFENYVNYTEDIFVGYRYFETFAPEKVAYPFGFGLSYTTFTVKTQSAALEKNTVKLSTLVKNTGNFPGREVVQAYLTAPQGKLGKASKVLCAFHKTRELKPGEAEEIKLSFDIRQFGSFDDLGKIQKSAFLLEKGTYSVHIGTNVRDTEQVLTFELSEDIVCRQCHEYMAPRALAERLTADGTMEKLPLAEKKTHRPKGNGLQVSPCSQFPLSDALEKGQIEEFIASLTEDDLGEFLHGHPMMNASNTNGIGLNPRDERIDVLSVPLVPTADGPMGLRIRQGRGATPTFFPCENTVSQTWDLALVRKVGKTIAREVKENNIGIWLAPGMNIHRNPMGGRNFEYYSEDPLTSGLIASACVGGVQSEKIVATVKHFCCNNRENNRRITDSRVSQRALREIYLRGFEIVVKKAKPWALMTSYNPVNGEQASSNWEAINGILRGEWKYDGVVMTDWRVLSNLEDEVHAGSDVKMPTETTPFYQNAPVVCDPGELIRNGKLDKNAAITSVRRILKMMGRLE